MSGGPASPDAFRAEVRAFLREALPGTLREKVRLGLEPDKQEVRVWEAALRDRGWLVPHWPVEWGGTGWSPAQRAAFQE